MGIRIIRKGKSYRRWWYGEYREGGKLCRIKLGVKVSGRPPESFSCKDVGDSAFEVSKAKAQSAFDDFMESRQQKGNAEGLLENLIKSKTGEKVSYVRMDELAELWNGLARTRELAERRKRDNACVINRFAKFCGREYLYQVSAADVISYFNEIRKTLAWSSVKSHMSILSGAFNRFLPNGCANPFKKIIKRDTSEEADFSRAASLPLYIYYRHKPRSKASVILRLFIEPAASITCQKRPSNSLFCQVAVACAIAVSVSVGNNL